MASIISNLNENGNFSLLSFYLRRARRIIPALIFLIVLIILLGLIILSPEELIKLSEHAASSILFFSKLVTDVSLIVKVDFGKEIGVKESSAQITHYYNEENLLGKQVIGVCNFPEKNIAGVKSQVLILGSIDKEGRVTLVHPSQKAENGLPIA